jgi:hypothetical protein
MGTQRETTTNTAGPQDPAAARMLALLSSTAQGAEQQMGDLSNISAGDFQLSPQMLAQISRIQRILGDQSRMGMERNLEAAQRAGEDTAIGRNMTGGSFEAIQNAILGGQFMHDANMGELGREAQGAEFLTQVPFQAAQTQIAGNRALLDRLVGGAGGVTNYDAAMRQLNSTKVTEKEVPVGQMLFQAATQIGSNMLMPGLPSQPAQAPANNLGQLPPGIF